MALAKCPECGKKVSSKASNCIHCGCPLEEVCNKPANVSSTRSKQKKLLPIILIACILLIAITSAIIWGPELFKSAEDKLVDCPSQEYVIECLNKVPGITEIAAVTEDNDPNGQLNKPGGYTAQVYFAYNLVPQESYLDGDLIEQGTDAGGSIEVYTSKKDAKQRNEYLGSFDGSAFASGSHIVVGTVVIRTSNKLTASQQEELESNIIAALLGRNIQKNENNQDNSLESNKSNNDNVNQVSKPVNRNESAVAEAIKQAKIYYPTDRHFIKHILENPSITEGFDAFTADEATYAIELADIDWKLHALGAIDRFTNSVDAFDEESNPDGESWWYVVYDSVKNGGDFCPCTGFTEDELQYAMENCGVNWKVNPFAHKEQAINDMIAYGYGDYTKVLTMNDFMFYLFDLGYDDTTISYVLDNTSGYYRGEAVDSEQERVELLLAYGYTRDAIIDWYSESMDYMDAVELVDSCIE